MTLKANVLNVIALVLFIAGCGPNKIWYNPTVDTNQRIQDEMACEEYSEQRVPDYDVVVDKVVRDPDAIDGYDTTCTDIGGRRECTTTPRRSLYATKTVQKVERRSGSYYERQRVKEQCLMSKGYRLVDPETKR